MQLVFYVTALVVIGGCMRALGRPAEMGKNSKLPSAIGAIALGLAFIFLPGIAQAHHKVYSPFVDKGTVELEYRDHRTTDDRDDESKAQKHRFEIGYGVSERW